MSKVIFACIGGFLGAGKSTALGRAAAELGARGLRVAVITNDQGSGLVDTQVMRRQGLATEEIAGGCFCCKFDDLIRSVGAIKEKERPDIILAEAVGSCTDFSATVYLPLRRYYPDQFDLAPLSVLVEPGRARLLLQGSTGKFDESVRYLFQKQLCEADLVLLNKVDTIGIAELEQTARLVRELIGAVPLHAMSARTNTGVSEWIDLLLRGGPAGGRVLEIDYDTYAVAEAALGWLNAAVVVSSPHPISPGGFTEAFVTEVRRGVQDSRMTIAHLKVFVTAGEDSDHIALTDDWAEPQWSGRGDYRASQEMSLLINARVCSGPAELLMLIRRTLAECADRFDATPAILHVESFAPKRPEPIHRLSKVAI